MLPEPSLDFAAYRAAIDAKLVALSPAPLPGQTALRLALRDSVIAPGKRLRPLICVIAAEDLGGPSEPALAAGCAVEMVHAASLVLDDLPCMDDAAMRRGRPATHVAHGEDVAVLAAIGALAGAFQLLATLPDTTGERRAEAVAVLSAAVGVKGLVGGQFADLRGGRERRQMSEIRVANGLKTGALFRASADLGGILAGADPAARDCLCSFGSELGHAFQLYDDLLDATQNPVLLGKDVGQDAGKSTILSLVGSGSAERLIERHLERADAHLAELFGSASRLSALVAQIFAQADRTVRQAREAQVAGETGRGAGRP
ncbi:polyprenyl synthetase family protein [Aurantimonas sp. MSK8Z-1]|uniref:polyprenyl synthetase family protein n=1 Tax=Mangrovibrevibacter kandeliae TaxID=2968473 RepID=UPI0021192BCD|nr:polyprenyl synthetase family protein [Aurantimonas sp. MSK8Z-1]MCW4115509.1 polyprenyl synthetase family protein [Aurantimonas sp. MSK8Z-1]